MKTNKLLSVLLCLVLCVALALVPVINANAAETVGEPFSVDATWEEGQSHVQTWTPAADGTYTVAITCEMESYQLIITEGETVVETITAAAAEVELKAGTEYTLTANGGERYPAGSMRYTITQKAEVVDSDPNSETVSFAEGAGQYIWTATMTGEVKVTVTNDANDGILWLAVADQWTEYFGQGDPTVAQVDSQDNVTFTATEGTQYLVYFWTNGMGTAGNATFKFEQAGGEGPDVPPTPEDPNTVEYTGGFGEFTWTADQTGKFKVTINDVTLWTMDVIYDGVSTGSSSNSVTFDAVEGRQYVIKFETYDEGISGKTTYTIELVPDEPVKPTATPLDLNKGQYQISGDAAYSFTATEDGTLKLNNVLLMMPNGTSLKAYIVGKEDQAQTLTANGEVALEMKKDEVAMIEVTYGEAMVVAFTPKFESLSGPAATPLKLGNTSLEMPGEVAYSYTATEAGKLTLTLGGALMGDVSATVYVNGDKANATTLGPNGTTDLMLNANDAVMIEVNCTGYSTLTAAFVSETDLPDGTEEKPYPIEELPYTMEQAGFYTWKATGNGALCISTDGTVKVYVVAADGTKEEVNPARATELRYEVTKGDNLLIELTGEGAQAQVSFELNRDGTYSAPWLIDQELPYDLSVEKFNGADGSYYEWVATIDGTLYLTGVPAGAYISITAYGPYENIEGGYKVPISVGDKIVLNTWGHSTEEGYTLHMEARTPDQEPADETLDSIENVEIVIGSGEEHSCEWIATEDGALTLTLKESTMAYGYWVEVLYKGETYTLTADAPVELANVAANDRIVIKATTEFSTAGGTISIEGSFVPEGGDVPPAGDNMVVVYVLAIASMMALAVVIGKKKAF